MRHLAELRDVEDALDQPGDGADMIERAAPADGATATW